ncbi:MAG: right-handed parallel beta-helix repeat-containing protein, partial [Patescibacteria group bacterium]
SFSPIIASTDISKPIRILRASPSEAWGTFAVVNTENDKNVFNYVQFNGGSGAKINGITFTGMVAFHNSDADIKNSSFINAGDDDGLNIKYGRVLVENSYFSQNFSDGLDIDFSDKETKIINNQFIANGYGGGGDGIDLSWSDILIEGNKILTCTDKGISIGESSNSFINNNEINGCDIGIAVKDLSKAKIENNIISDVRVGIAVYRKKDVFGGAEAYLKGNIIKSAKIDYEKDDLSKINIL